MYPSIPARDLGRAKRFYEKLGFKPIEEGPEGAYYATGDTKFFLYESAYAGTNQATTAGWEVDDLDKEMSELRSRGVVFEEYDLPGIKTVNGIATVDSEKAAWFKDSEGNILNIAEVLH